MDTNYPRINNHEFIPYPVFTQTHDQFTRCLYCSWYLAVCPCHFNELLDPCHNFKLVFTDSACSNNGQPNATSRIGRAMGTVSDYRWSISINDSIDSGKSRTSQHAELLAAIYGLKKINEVEMDQAESIRRHDSTAYKSQLNVNIWEMLWILSQLCHHHRLLLCSWWYDEMAARVEGA